LKIFGVGARLKLEVGMDLKNVTPPISGTNAGFVAFIRTKVRS